MKIIIWFCLSCKRQLKRPFFLVLLMLLPVLVYGAGRLEKQDETGISIALYTEEEGMAEEIIEKLIAGPGMFTFYQCDSQEELEADVASKRAECGYVFFSDLEEKLDQGQYKRSIGVYSAPSTVAASLSTEVVFSMLMEVYGRDLLENYVTTAQVFSHLNGVDVWGETEKLYDKYYQNGSTFSFQYETMSRLSLEEMTGKAVFPVRGITAIYIFVIGLFSAVTLCGDEKKGLFLPVSRPLRFWCKLASMLAPVSLAAVSGLCGLVLSGTFEGAGKELAAMAVYGVAVVGFAFLLKVIVPNPAALCSMIPFFILGSLILCPVFLDLGQWIPEAEKLGRCFIPYYYLKKFV